ncbi:MAG: hypothetical protein U0169_19225 [Polyangiaceae bacterium]
MTKSTSDRLRLLLIVVGFAGFVVVAGKREPVAQWLSWRYAGYGALALAWAFGCLSTGTAIVRRVVGSRLPLREELATSFATGVFAYYLVASVAGLLHAFGTTFFVLVPVGMGAIGARPLFRTLRRVARRIASARPRSLDPSWRDVALLAFGLVGFALVYLQLFTPDNVQFDSRWKHFALAEEYAVTHGVRRFGEGWTVETNPHLATYVYTWAFTMPFGGIFDRAELAAHMEFVVFVATTLSIAPLVRKLLPRTHARHLWAVRFLFPGVFLYDSNVSGGADHVAALFTVPLALALVRGFRDFSPRHGFLAAVMATGTAMSKLTGLLMFGPVLALAVLAGAVAFVRRGEGARGMRLLGTPLVVLVTCVVLSSTFWAKNWVWYGDPIYPSSFSRLTLRPWTEDAANLFVWGYQDYQFWRPPRSFAGVLRTLRNLVTFSFVPNDYPRYHKDVPVFGSLFTILVPTLFVGARRSWRTIGLATLVHVALFVWYWIHHQDRYLQTLVPWMAAVTAVALVLAFRAGGALRLVTGALVAFQIVWGADVAFVGTHAMIGGSPFLRTMALLGSTMYPTPTRFAAFEPWTTIGASLPERARVLLHDDHDHLGLARETINDWNAWQFGISYGRHGTPGETFDALTSLGATHVVWKRGESEGWDSIAGDLVFFRFATKETFGRRSVGAFEVATMPERRPTSNPLETVQFYGCGTTYADGLYPLAAMRVPMFGPTRSTFPKPMVPGAGEAGPPPDAIVIEIACVHRIPAGVRGAFTEVAHRKALHAPATRLDVSLWLRDDPRP